MIIPARFAPLVMPFILSLMMTAIVSLVSSIRAVGFHATTLLHIWPGAWLISWIIAFPTLLLFMPIARRISEKLLRL